MACQGRGSSNRLLIGRPQYRAVCNWCNVVRHYSDVTMGTIASQITSLTIVYSTVYSGTHQRKHQSSASPVFVWGIHRSSMNSPHKGPVTRKMFLFDYVIINIYMKQKVDETKRRCPFTNSVFALHIWMLFHMRLVFDQGKLFQILLNSCRHTC